MQTYKHTHNGFLLLLSCLIFGFLAVSFFLLILKYMKNTCMFAVIFATYTQGKKLIAIILDLR